MQVSKRASFSLPVDFFWKNNFGAAFSAQRHDQAKLIPEECVKKIFVDNVRDSRYIFCIHTYLGLFGYAEAV